MSEGVLVPETHPDPRVRVRASAERLGVTLNEEEVDRWLSAMADSDSPDIAVDDATGVFGHKISLLDFSDKDLERFRAIGKIVGFTTVPGEFETALALSGSAAQSRIQTHPGDADYFERINVIAPTREAACTRFAEAMRQKVIDTTQGPGYQMIEVKFGNHPADAVIDGEPVTKGSPITWRPEQVAAGVIEATDADGNPAPIQWDDVAHDPGWTKLDWIIADPIRGELTNASNMLDVTWEGPDGAIVALDGYLDGYFQEVYLDTQSAPLFAKLKEHASPDALDEYVDQLRQEAAKYWKQPHYGKAAKRLYNAMRLGGQYEEAAFIRELFDEPAAMLYQIHALVRTVEEAAASPEVFALDDLIREVDDLILDAINALEGAAEREIVARLQVLQHALREQDPTASLSAGVEAAQSELMNLVNNFFQAKLTGVPRIRSYIEDLIGK